MWRLIYIADVFKKAHECDAAVVYSSISAGYTTFSSRSAKN